MLFLDSLIDTERVARRPLAAWMKELTSRCRSFSRTGGSNDELSGIQNNHALITLHLVGPTAAVNLCERQIAWSFRVDEPTRALQPYVNMVRVFRMTGDVRNLVALQRLRSMAVRRMGEVPGHGAFEILDEDADLCAVNYLRETFRASRGREPIGMAIGFEDVEDLIGTDAARAVHCEHLRMAACQSGDIARLEQARTMEGSAPGNYDVAIARFYEAAFAGEWMREGAVAERTLRRLVALIEGAMGPRADHRLLRFAAAVARLSRGLDLPALATDAGRLWGELACGLDDVLHRSDYLNEFAGLPDVARSLTTASGYGLHEGVQRGCLTGMLRELDAVVAECTWPRASRRYVRSARREMSNPHDEGRPGSDAPAPSASLDGG